MKQEPDIKAVTQEASVLVAKATELFLEFLTSRAAAKRGSNEPLGYVDLGAPLARPASPPACSSAWRSTRGAALRAHQHVRRSHALSLTLPCCVQPTPSLRANASTSWPTSCRARCPAAWRRSSRAQAQPTEQRCRRCSPLSSLLSALCGRALRTGPRRLWRRGRPQCALRATLATLVAERTPPASKALRATDCACSRLSVKHCTARSPAASKRRHYA